MEDRVKISRKRTNLKVYNCAVNIVATSHIRLLSSGKVAAPNCHVLQMKSIYHISKSQGQKGKCFINNLRILIRCSDNIFNMLNKILKLTSPVSFYVATR